MSENDHGVDLNAYRIATGQDYVPPEADAPPAAQPAAASGSYLTTDQVCGRLAALGVDAKQVSQVFSARLQPQNLADADRKFALGVRAADQVYIVVYKFGLGTPLVRKSPLDEDGPDWRPRWVSVEGPYPNDKAVIEAKAAELTA